MERSLSPLTDLGQQAPNLLAAVADSVDASVKGAASRGIDIEQRSTSLLHLAESLTAPHTAQALQALLEHADKLEPLLLMANDVPGLAAAAVDTADAYAQRARRAGVDIEQMVDDASVLAVGASRAANRALADQRQGQAAPSLLGVMRLLGDADVRRALGFFLTFAKEFGSTLKALPHGGKHEPL